MGMEIQIHKMLPKFRELLRDKGRASEQLLPS
jgi:hypothetical protein